MKIHLLWPLAILAGTLYGQDTLRVTFRQADSLLLVRNLSLIASRFEVDKAEANRVQAKLFNNPELSTEWSLYNPGKARWLDVGDSGQKIFALQQVFRIAGQRSAAIRLAEEQKRMTEFQYYEMARALKFELHTAFYRYHFLDRAITNIRLQLALLKRLIEVYKEQYLKGNISLQELTRLNTTYFAIDNQVNETQAELLNLQRVLKILLCENNPVQPIVEKAIPTPPPFSLAELQQRALSNRSDIKILESLQMQNELRLTLEKKATVPDVVIGAVYDQAGSYIRNYTAFTVGLRLPLFNRNQGNIRAARIQIQQGEILLQSKQQEVMHEVESALGTFMLRLEQYNAIGNDFEEQLAQLSEGLISNYSKNNISLLEFTDLFESYNLNIIQFNQLKSDLNKAYEELHYAVGEDLGR